MHGGRPETRLRVVNLDLTPVYSSYWPKPSGQCRVDGAYNKIFMADRARTYTFWRGSAELMY